MIIGITGKSGVGKSTYACALAKTNGFYVVNVDEIAHQIIDRQEIKLKLTNVFGEEIIKDGRINRKHLGDLIFTARHMYKELSNVVWEEIKNEIKNILSKHKNVILDWILLPHSCFWEMCDKKILITADETQRKKMVIKRDNISKEYLKKRDLASISYENFEFDKIINNKYTEYFFIGTL